VVEQEYGCIVGRCGSTEPLRTTSLSGSSEPSTWTARATVASVLSKDRCGSSHLVLDMPVGPTAKVRTAETAQALSKRLIDVGAVRPKRAWFFPTVFSPSGGDRSSAGSSRRPGGPPEQDLGLDGAPAAGLRLAGALLELGGGAREGQG
jgi:thymidine phosphorylase